MQLENLKIYIEIDLVNSFIKPFKSLAGALILVVLKLDNNFHLYVNY